jgi:hypothetical protein
MVQITSHLPLFPWGCVGHRSGLEVVWFGLCGPSAPTCKPLHLPSAHTPFFVLVFLVFTGVLGWLKTPVRSHFWIQVLDLSIGDETFSGHRCSVGSAHPFGEPWNLNRMTSDAMDNPIRPRMLTNYLLRWDLDPKLLAYRTFPIAAALSNYQIIVNACMCVVFVLLCLFSCLFFYSIFVLYYPHCKVFVLLLLKGFPPPSL